MKLNNMKFMGIGMIAMLVLSVTSPTLAAPACVTTFEGACPLLTRQVELGLPHSILTIRSGKIKGIQSYGIPGWGDVSVHGYDVHNGMDLIVDNTGATANVGDRIPVLSPVTGEVIAVQANVSSPGTSSALVVIKPLASIVVLINFEPQFTPGYLPAPPHPTKLITVKPGDTIEKGDVIGDLMVGDGGMGTFKSGNPHIDLRVLLFDPTVTPINTPDDVERLVDSIMAGNWSHNDVANLPTFLCPYAFSDSVAKTYYDAILQRSDPNQQCTCACLTNYNFTSCGTCED